MASAAQTLVLALAAATAAAAATGTAAATFGELTGAGPVGMNGMNPSYAAGPYANAPYVCPPNCVPAATGYGAWPGATTGYAPMMMGPAGTAMPLRGGPEGVPPGDPGASPEGPFVPALAANPRAYLPFRSYADGPNAPLMLWSFGQVNSGTDPYNPFGLSTPYMRVPWSTPMAGWTNSQTWNWWRERSGALPRNW